MPKTPTPQSDLPTLTRSDTPDEVGCTLKGIEELSPVANIARKHAGIQAQANPSPSMPLRSGRPPDCQWTQIEVSE